MVALVPSDGPVKYYRYDRDKKKAEFIFSSLKALEGLPLSQMHPVVIKERDGLELVSYLTLPKTSDADGEREAGQAASDGAPRAWRSLGA